MENPATRNRRSSRQRNRRRWRLALAVLVALNLGYAAVGPLAEPAAARSRTIHPCLLGDEPCNTPAPTPQPR